MIDFRNIKIGYKEFVAGEILLVTLVTALGLYSQKGYGAQTADPGDGGEYTAEVSAAGSTDSAEEEAAAGSTDSPVVSTEYAAEEEPEKPGETGGSDENRSAAYTRVKEDGEYATEVISSAGEEKYSAKELILVNPWHLLPEDYEVVLENVEYGHQMDECAAEHMRDMLADCRAEGYSPLICSSYRERSKQERLFENDVRRFMYGGMTEEEAREETARNVAVPGSSEHEAGLACDVVYSGYQVLDESQELNDTQQWLMEHCWEYGFILRYPRDKQEITGITYEPWHYRYVGYEAAEKIMSEGICLEEYLGVIDANLEYAWPDEYEDEEDSGDSGEEEESAFEKEY